MKKLLVTLFDTVATMSLWLYDGATVARHYFEGKKTITFIVAILLSTPVYAQWWKPKPTPAPKAPIVYSPFTTFSPPIYLVQKDGTVKLVPSIPRFPRSPVDRGGYFEVVPHCTVITAAGCTNPDRYYVYVR